MVITLDDLEFFSYPDDGDHCYYCGRKWASDSPWEFFYLDNNLLCKECAPKYRRASARERSRKDQRRPAQGLRTYADDSMCAVGPRPLIKSQVAGIAVSAYLVCGLTLSACADGPNEMVDAGGCAGGTLVGEGAPAVDGSAYAVQRWVKAADLRAKENDGRRNRDG